ILDLGQDLLTRFPDQADYANQAIGAALFGLKRVEEAHDYLTKVAPADRSAATQRVLERIAAGNDVGGARDRFAGGLALADAGDVKAAARELNGALAALHPRPSGDVLPRT